MAKGNFRTNDRICLYCGHTEQDNSKMPYKIGKGANKSYLCKRCFMKTSESTEDDINKYLVK